MADDGLSALINTHVAPRPEPMKVLHSWATVVVGGVKYCYVLPIGDQLTV